MRGRGTTLAARCGLLLALTVATSLAPAAATTSTASTTSTTVLAPTRPDSAGDLVDVELLPIPEPNLEEVDPAIREQLLEMKGAVDELTGGGRNAVVGAADAFARLGQLYFLYGLLDAAEAALANARSLEPDFFDWTYYLGAVRQQQHDAPTATANLERALELRPGHPQTLVRLGRLALEQSQLETAVGYFEAALAADPTLAAALLGLGEVASLEGRTEEAIARFEEVLLLQPEATSVHYQLGTAYRDLGDREKAREHLGQRGEAKVRLPDPLMEELAGLVTGAGIYIVRGTTAFTRGDLESAVTLYGMAVSQDPENLIGRQALASALARSGRVDEALAQFLLVLEKDPANSFAHYNVGTLRVAQGRLEEGIDHFQQAVELAPEFTDAWFNLATALERAGRDREAEAAYARVAEIDPQDPSPRLQRSRVLLRLGRLDDAERELAGLVALDPGNARALFTLAETLERLGRREEAGERYRSILALEVPPLERGLTHYQLGLLEAELGDLPEALANLEAAVGTLQGQIEPALALARVAGQAGEFETAAVAFAEVLRLDPDNTGALFGRAIALLLADRPNEAREHLEGALERRPGDLGLQHALARLLATSPDPASRDGVRALELARDVFSREQSIDHAETVAMALAETGNFVEAAQWQQRVLDEAAKAGRTGDLEERRRRLSDYKQGRPCRSPWLGGS